MKKTFHVSLLTLIFSLSLVCRGHGFKFSITRYLDDPKPLNKNYWTNIEIVEDCEEDPTSHVTFKVDTLSELVSEDQMFREDENGRTDDWEPLERRYFEFAKLTDLCWCSNELLGVQINITIFFANDDHNVLEVHLIKSTTEGLYYTTPYKLERRMKGPETSRVENGDRIEISGMFPKSWLPGNCNLVSGSLTLGDGRYYNYYNLRNFKMSILDLKVLEEYKKYKSCS